MVEFKLDPQDELFDKLGEPGTERDKLMQTYIQMKRSLENRKEIEEQFLEMGLIEKASNYSF